jgi:AcrR family transcriptional regulator
MTVTQGDKKDRIVAAAMKLWQRAHNVNKVSLADVADEAGVSPTTIYNYFGTREGLVHEVIRRLADEIVAEYKGILKSDLAFPQKMQAMISAKMRGMKGIEVDLLDKICTDPYSKQYVDTMTETEYKPIMKKIIAQGKNEGYVRQDMRDEAIMLYFEILKSGGVACAEEMKRVVTDKDMMLAFTRLIYFGLFQREFEISLNGAEKK